MKKIIIVFAVLLIALVHKTIGDEQKFKVTFSISFDEMTLSQAAEIEKDIRSKFEKNKGCRIETSMSSNRPTQGLILRFDDTSHIRSSPWFGTLKDSTFFLNPIGK